MPGLPHHIFELSKVRRLSANTSSFVSSVPTCHALGPTDGVPFRLVPGALTAMVLACEMPVPFGKFTPVKLFQVTGTGRNVKGSEINSSSLGIQWNSRSPVNDAPGTKQAPFGEVGPQDRKVLWFHSFWATTPRITVPGRFKVNERPRSIFFTSGARK